MKHTSKSEMEGITLGAKNPNKELEPKSELNMRSSERVPKDEEAPGWS